MMFNKPETYEPEREHTGDANDAAAASACIDTQRVFAIAPYQSEGAEGGRMRK